MEHIFDFSQVTTWFHELLMQTLGLSEFFAILIECVLVGAAILGAYSVIAMILIFMERKVCAYFQCRIGPVRVGPWGLMQVLADVLKMLIKEIFIVDKADKLLYIVAPFLVIIGSVGAFAFLPWNRGAHILDFNVGIFLLTAISSIGVVGIFLAGWGESQAGPWGWLIVKGHVPAIIAFLVFLIAGNAEANRGPFDMAEAESELTAGHHTEYSGMGFGFFYLAEFLNLFIIAGIAATVFLGGWAPIQIGVEAFDEVMQYIPGIVWFMGKAFLLVWLLMWIKWTFPRLRIDQILKLEWKYLMPLALINLVLMTVIVAFGLYL